MAQCLNKSLPEFQKLTKETGWNPFILEAKIVSWQTENNNLQDFPTIEELLSSKAQIQYRLKAVNILLSDKAKQVFTKGEKNGWNLNKILTELQVSKGQKKIILDKDITNREEIITSLLADNSFVVEVNTATKENYINYGGDLVLGKNDIVTVDGYSDKYKVIDEEGKNLYTLQPLENEYDPETNPNGVKPLFNIHTDLININDKTPTQHYANLTVPGGTNYTENEISTPAIKPNIKGHAQFSTDEGIGWFRSDDKYGSKTRRVLEVQSDLFQKGRDKKGLIKPKLDLSKEDQQRFFIGDVKYEAKISINEDTGETNEYYVKSKVDNTQEIDFWGTNPKTVKEETISKQEYEKQYQSLAKDEELNKQNQFLQLLNKKGNWVNFFIQSIVQDSIKKGYEKVLFPTGETAAKVEGHETIADEIRGINNQLANLEKILAQKDYKNFTINSYNYQIQKNKYYKGENDDPFGALSPINKAEYDKAFARDHFKNEKVKLEAEKQEMKSQGIEKLKPIEAFYTNKVTNILNKLYDVKKVTDEQGNTWNEVDLSSSKTFSKAFQIDFSIDADDLNAHLKTKEWKKFSKQVGEKLAHITYTMEGGKIPNIKTATEIKKGIGFQKHVENFGPLSGRIAKYNSINNTSHSFTKKLAWGNTWEITMRYNYLPVNQEKKRQRNAKLSEIFRVEELDGPIVRETPLKDIQQSLFEDTDFLIDAASSEVEAVTTQKLKALKTRYNEIKDKLAKVTTISESKILQTQKNTIERLIEKTKVSKVKASTIENFEGVLEMADEQLAELEKVLEQPIISYSDILYGLRAADLWIVAGDNTKEPGRHILLDEEERDTPEIINAFSLRRIKAEEIQRRLLILAREQMTTFVRKYTNENLTKEEIFKNLKDINKVHSLTLNLSRTEDALLQSIMGAVETANILAKKEADKIWKGLDSLGDKVIKKLNNYNKFKQLTKDGKETGKLVNRFSDEFFKVRANLINKAFHQRDASGAQVYKKQNIDEYYNWIDNNTINMDVRLLFEDSFLEDSQVPNEFLYKRVIKSEKQKEAHITTLKSHLGEKGFEKYMDMLEKKLKKWKLQRDVMWSKITTSELSLEEQKTLFEEWNKEHSPYWGLDMAENPAMRKKSDGISYYIPKGIYEYTYQIPKKFGKNGSETAWYDKNFEEIEANEDLLAFHELITNTLYELKYIFPESKQNLLGINILPTIQKSLMDQFSEKGMMMGVIPFWDKMKSLVTTSDLAEIDHSDQNPRTGLREKQIATQFIADTNAQVLDIVKTKIIEFEQNNGKKPTIEQINAFKEDAKDYLSKQKSWDLVKIMKAYSMMGLAFKHKSFIEPQIKLAEQLFNNKKQIVENKGGIAKRRNNETEEIITEDGLANYKGMLRFYLDSEYYGIGARKVEGVSKKKLYSSEENKRKLELEQLLQGAVTEEQKEFLQKEIDGLGSVVTGSGVGDAALKFMTYKGLGWNVFSAFSNIGFGVISNIIESADGRNYTGEQMRKAYLLTLNSVGKNLSEYIPGMKSWKGVDGAALKIRTLMDQWDLLKTSNQELYDLSSKSSFSKGIAKFGPMTLQERSEYLNYAPTMIAVMMNLKAKDADGNEVNVWEAYDVEGNLKEEYTLPGPETDLVRKIRRVIEMNHGDYNNPLKAKETFMGRALSQFRTWMFEGFANRFEEYKPDYALSYGSDEVYERKGRYRSYSQGQLATTGAVVGSTILPGIGTLIGGGVGYLAGMAFGIKSEQSGISDVLFTLKQLVRKLAFKDTQFGDRFTKLDAANMRKNMTELYMYVALYGIALLLRAVLIDDDDEEGKKSFIANFLLNQTTRLQTDIGFYTNPLEFKKLTKTAVPLAQLIEDVAVFAGDVGSFFDDDDKNDVFRGGPFKGESKGLVHFGQILPGTSQAIRLYRTGSTVFDK